MMKRLFLASACLLLTFVRPCRTQTQTPQTQPAEGQQVQGPPAADFTEVQDIPYLSSVPSEVRKRIPHSARSFFFGRFVPTASSREIRGTTKRKELAVHLYSSYLTKDHQLEYPDYSFKVDLFEVNKTNQKQGDRYHFLRTIPFGYVGMPWRATMFRLRFIWLEPRKQQQPILIFDCFTKGECLGKIGDEILMMFPQGWQGKALTQRFLFDQGAGCGAVNVLTVGFNLTLDKHGFIRFYTSDWHPPDGPTQMTYFNWNGQEFVEEPKLAIDDKPLF